MPDCINCGFFDCDGKGCSDEVGFTFFMPRKIYERICAESVDSGTSNAETVLSMIEAYFYYCDR